MALTTRTFAVSSLILCAGHFQVRFTRNDGFPARPAIKPSLFLSVAVAFLLMCTWGPYMCDVRIRF